MTSFYLSDTKRLRQVRKARDARNELDVLLRDIVVQARREFDVKTAFVTLVDEDVQYLLAGDVNGQKTTDRAVSFCAHSLGSRRCFVVEDARHDSRFCLNPLVMQPPHLVFYAGAPIVVAGDAHVGNFVVMDQAPRPFGPAQCQRLQDFAAQAAQHMQFES